MQGGESVLFVLFVIAASFVVYTAINVTKYVSAFNEKANISTGFVGLIIFSLITSLPELLTSSYAIILGQPTMSFGNILGSNVFNLLILTIINLIFLKKRMFNNVSYENQRTLYVIITLNVIALLGLYFPWSLPIPFFHISIASATIFILYFLVIYRSYKSQDIQEEEAESSGLMHLTIQQIVLRGLLYIVLMIIFSLVMTRISDQIVIAYPEIGATLVGTLMLAVATSLPELVTTYTLCKMGHANIAIAGIIGSSLFNFNILFVTDLLSTKLSIFEQAYQSPDIDILKVLVFLGMGLTIYLSIYFKVAKKLKKIPYVAFSLGLIAIYLYCIQFMFS
nr:hypothetical protein [Enterococcus rivorum]